MILLFFCSVRHGLHKLPNSMVYLLVPGSNYILDARFTM